MAFRIAATQIAKRAALAAPQVRNNISGGWLGMERERERGLVVVEWLAGCGDRAGWQNEVAELLLLGGVATQRQTGMYRPQ